MCVGGGGVTWRHCFRLRRFFFHVNGNTVPFANMLAVLIVFTIFLKSGAIFGQGHLEN